MKEDIRKYLVWSALGGIAGPFLWIVFAAWHVSHYHPEMGSFGDGIRQLTANLATGKEVPMLLSMAVPAGAILFVLVRAVIAVITFTISRVRPHDDPGKSPTEIVDLTPDSSVLDYCGDEPLRCDSVTG